MAGNRRGLVLAIDCAAGLHELRKVDRVRTINIVDVSGQTFAREPALQRANHKNAGGQFQIQSQIRIGQQIDAKLPPSSGVVVAPRDLHQAAPAVAIAVSALRVSQPLADGLHEAGKSAELLRVAEKAPLDLQVDAIQARYNPYVQAKKGKVAMGKDALGVLLTAWRTEQQRLAAIAAAKAREEADALRAEAEAAIRASSGNLVEREAAEQTLQFAKTADRFAKRADKAATTGTGLRTVWVATLTDAEAALEWAYGRDPNRFTALVQQMADEAVRGGIRVVPGFEVKEEKKAA